MGTNISFKRPDGKDASGYLANAARGNAPGVVVIQEWWGLQEQIKGLCDRFAVAGFDALAPDLYKGKVVPYHDTDAAGKEMNSLHFMDATTQTGRGVAPRGRCHRCIEERGGVAIGGGAASLAGVMASLQRAAIVPWRRRSAGRQCPKALDKSNAGSLRRTKRWRQPKNKPSHPHSHL